MSANDVSTVWMHCYNEQAARSKVARHIRRGDTDVCMRWWDGTWHVGPLSEWTRWHPELSSD